MPVNMYLASMLHATVSSVDRLMREYYIAPLARQLTESILALLMPMTTINVNSKNFRCHD